MDGIINLLENGEERLVAAVESGHMPISIAIRIADTQMEDEQVALQEIYETSELRGKKFLKLKSVLIHGARRGKSIAEQRLRTGVPCKVSAKSIVLSYKKEIERKQVLVDDARRVKEWLML